MGVGAWTALGSVEGGEWKGRGWDNPYIGFAMSLFLLSLAGAPLTLGFVGRLHLLSALVRDVHIGVVAAALLNLLLCFYCYGKLFLDLFASPEPEKNEGFEAGKGIAVSLVLCALVIVILGVWPEPYLSLVQQVAMEFF
jgi:NADH-quinone oxidoreductase subunit N